MDKCKLKRRKQNHKISFHFFAAPPCNPRLLNGLVRKFLVLYASGASARRAQVGVTTLSERKTKFRITTRSARALVFKILRILFVKSSNFVQETPQLPTRKWKLLGCCMLREKRGIRTAEHTKSEHSSARVRAGAQTLNEWWRAQESREKFPLPAMICKDGWEPSEQFIISRVRKGFEEVAWYFEKISTTCTDPACLS